MQMVFLKERQELPRYFRTMELIILKSRANTVYEIIVELDININSQNGVLCKENYLRLILRKFRRF